MFCSRKRKSLPLSPILYFMFISVAFANYAIANMHIKNAYELGIQSSEGTNAEVAYRCLSSSEKKSRILAYRRCSNYLLEALVSVAPISGPPSGEQVIDLFTKGFLDGYRGKIRFEIITPNTPSSK